MNSKKQINEAMVYGSLNLWERQNFFLIRDHLADSQLYCFIMGFLLSNAREEILKHLSFCKACRQRLWEIKQIIHKERQILDIALPKAAASQEKTTFAVLTEGGRCRILFRKLLNQKGKGVINLRVEPPYQDELEGRSVVVTDNNGKELIRGNIVKGETPGVIVDADKIDWETLIVREDV